VCDALSDFDQDLQMCDNVLCLLGRQARWIEEFQDMFYENVRLVRIGGKVTP